MHSVYHRPHQRTPSPTCTSIRDSQLRTSTPSQYAAVLCPSTDFSFHRSGGGGGGGCVTSGDCGDFVLVVVYGTAGWQTVVSDDAGSGYRAVTVWW
jgi:hypothetical protein